MATAVNITSWLASFIVLFAFFPQAYKTVKTKDVSGMALSPWIIDFFGCLMWCIYGAMIDASGGESIIACNGGIGILILPIMFFVCKARFKSKGAWISFFVTTTLWILTICISALGLNKIIDISRIDSLKIIIGILAGASTGFAFMPQAIRTIKTKITTGLSLWLLLLLNVGNLFWIIFWLLIFVDGTTSYSSSLPGVIFTTFSLVFGMALIITKGTNIVKLKEKY